MRQHFAARPNLRPFPAKALPSQPFETVYVGGFNTVVATREQLAAAMVRDCMAVRADRTIRPKLVFSSNGQGISLAGHNKEFAAIMRRADIVHADGMSVVKASRMLTRRPLPERVATTDFFHDAAQAAVEAGLRFYFLGAKEEQNKAAVENAQRLYPGLQIVGRRDGYFSNAENATVCREIVQSGADVLWVALGKPKQEFWAAAQRENLRGLGWIKTCGGLYAFLAGDVGRAPGWMQDMSLEWAHRLSKEPSRLAGRYLVTNAHALWRLTWRTRDRRMH